MLIAAIFKSSSPAHVEDEQQEILDEIATKEALNEPLLPDSDIGQSLTEGELKNRRSGVMSKYVMFGAMLMCGEFGDKSQITAIVLAATYNPYSVVIGGSLALMVCVFLAIVLG
eukprot:CAMPEP_0202958748 /NCGR_PEP_ID=MMETSP1396-20130829/3013_1 /ASSEMBLY_ACC=CAM_ASM_000872 /TAXON_ID= /ORGANISM="Pseudokeronopsis sp., Strain Brazil" /LENGTH=113 /DNA_ID=CAMNT_0049676957 /DNA_START=391 /DNA_END=732 /DNA_ORIENTATION=+